MMNEQSNQPTPNRETTELITSYLDGELTEEQRIEVETRLTRDHDFRTELQQLQKTWDLLDVLPRPEPRTSFTKTTLELVVKDASREAARDRAQLWAWPTRFFALFAVPILAFLFTNQVTDLVQNVDHRHLVNDLPLLENLYYYETAEDFLFLEALKKSQLFSDNDPWQDVTADGQQVETGVNLLTAGFSQREKTLESYDVDQLDQLNRKREKWLSLSEEQRQPLLEFHQRLLKAPDSETLQKILVRYYHWLKALDEVTRTETMDLPVRERIARIRAIKIREAEELFGLAGSTAVPDEDKKFVFAWMNGIVDSKRERIQRLTIREFQRKRDAIRRGEIQFNQRRRLGSGRAYIIDQLMVLSPDVAADLVFEDIETLKLGLSTAGQQVFEGRSEEDQKKLLLQWLRSAVDAQLVVTDEQLKAYYDTLPSDEKEELNNQDAERRRLILRQGLLSERSRRQDDPSSPDFLDDF